MMPTVQENASGQSTSQNTSAVQQGDGAIPATQGESVNYKKKYKVLKRKMRMLVYEQECFMEELKKAQRKLLKVSRDRSFLLDRLLQHEKLDDTSDDSDLTASSDSDAADGMKEITAAKKKKLQNQSALSLAGSSMSLLSGNLNKQQASWLQLQMSGEKGLKTEPGSKRKAARVGKKAGKGVAMTADAQAGTGHMTREELERHLELKQSAKPQFMSLETAPYSLPEDIFSHDNSNQDAEIPDIKKEDASSFVIHMPR